MLKQASLFLLTLASPALAQTVPPLSLTSQPTPLPRPPAAGSDAIGATFFYENDSRSAKPNNETDRHYTGGGAVALQWQSPQTSELVGSLPSFDGEFAKGTPGVSYGMGFIASLQVFTPEDIDDPAPIPDDRPYAGWLYGGLIAQRANRSVPTPVFEHFELDLGTIGPSSQADKVQRWLHARLGDTMPEGWSNQVKDDFGGDFKYLRRWRMDLGTHEDGSAALQLLPEAGATAGTMHINANAAATLRYGWNLPDDFGPGRVRYAGDFTRPFQRDNPMGDIGGYVFLRPGGRAVAHDSTIDGSFFRSSPVEQNSEVFVAEIAAGFAVQFAQHFEISYAQTYTSPEFIHQSAWDSYGTIMFSMVYAW